MATSRSLVANGAVKRAAIAYAAVWIVCVALLLGSVVFRCRFLIFGYTLCWMYVLLPLAAFAACAYAGWHQEAAAFPWAFILILTGAYALAPIVTFGFSTALGLANIATGDLWLLLMGFVPGVVGYMCGQVARAIFKTKRRDG